MKTLALCLAITTAVAFTCNSRAAEANLPTVRPTPRADKNSQSAHEQLLAKAKAGGIDVCFIGDSITRRWGATDPAYRALLNNWATNFFGWNAANFGWGGDKLENILWRLTNGELDGVNPKVIVVLAGTNNLEPNHANEETAAHIAAGTKAIVDVCLQKAPNAVIILTAIFPRNDDMAFVPVLNDANRRVAKLADGKQIRFLDINRKLADEQGRFFEGMVNSDKLHPSLKTYRGLGRRSKAHLHGDSRRARNDRSRATAYRRSERHPEQVCSEGQTLSNFPRELSPEQANSDKVRGHSGAGSGTPPRFIMSRKFRNPWSSLHRSLYRKNCPD